MIAKYKSVKSLIAKVYRDLNLTDEDRWPAIIEWAGEALSLIGAYAQFVPKTAYLTVSKYRTELPCDFYKPIQISFNNIALIEAKGSFDTTEECSDCGMNSKSTHTFVYTINDSYIHTNFNGELCLSYLAIPVDDDGYPLVPDDAAFDEALYYYVVMKLSFPDFISGKMDPRIYNQLEDTWNYKCMAARGAANMPTVDGLESLKNQWVRLIPDIVRHKDFFKNLNQGESIFLGKR